MKTPVIIAAYNEAELIGRTLDRLDAGTVEPLVVTNGCTDDTADIARSYGVDVIERAEAGKLPAIQHALEHLGNRALEPVLFIDADSYPLFPKRWAQTMVSPLAEAKTGAASGMLGFTDGPRLGGIVRTLKRTKGSMDARRADATSATFGANMAVKIGDVETFEEVMDMPHIWPGEDRALADLLRSQDGGVFYQSLNPGTLVYSSARFHISIFQRLKKGKEQAGKDDKERYMQRRASTATAAYLDGELLALGSEQL